MPETQYSLQGIDLPSNKSFVKRLTFFSKILSALVLLISGWALLGVFLNSSILQSPSMGLHPVGGVLFILAEVSLFLQLKNKLGEVLPLWKVLGSAVCAGIIIVVGLLVAVGIEQQLSIFPGQQLSVISGVGFMLIGTGLLLPVLRVGFLNRIRLAQFFVLVVSGIAFFALIQYAYVTSVSSLSSQNVAMPLFTSLTFLFVSLSILLAKANRGFMAVFTADTVSSVLASRFLVVIMMILPLLGYIYLFGLNAHFYDQYSGMALAITALVLVSIVAVWMNISNVYKLELERFVIREELRVRNIKLTINSEDLTGRVKELEEDKKEVVDKLTHQDTLKDVVEGLG